MARRAWRQGLLGIVVELDVPGRRSGRPRSTLVALLEVDGHWYVGHPDGKSGWTRNLSAAGGGLVVWPTGVERNVMAMALADGAERDAAIVAAGDQEPMPGRLLYRAGRAHVLVVGEYFRIEPSATGQPA
jgi:hypothetical protein